MRKPLVVGNWKMFGSARFTEELIEALKLKSGLPNLLEVAVCPPFPYLALASKILENSAIALGAQNICDQDEGAFTGEVAGSMLAEFGCRYVIVGHSERRHLYGETNELIAARFMAAQRHGLCPILCVGEKLDEREAGLTEQVIACQMDAVIQTCGVDALANAVVAYEPVWAIGTGKTASSEQAQDVHEYMRGRVAAASKEVAEGLRILYGGSVKPDNAQVLFAQADVDGGLIGGASLNADSFMAIAAAAG